jgi:hypothetical protein
MSAERAQSVLRAWEEWSDHLFKEAQDNPKFARAVQSQLACTDWELTRRTIGLKKQIADAVAVNARYNVVRFEENYRIVEAMARKLAGQKEALQSFGLKGV